MSEQHGTTDPHQERFQLLANLTPIEYDFQRNEVAKELGIRVSTLDSMVDVERPDVDIQPDTDELVVGVEPWEKSVNGNELADSMTKAIKRYCVLSDHTVIAVVLWIISSYSIDSFRIFAKLGVNSPQKRCGKTTFLEAVAAMCNRALLSSNLTPAVIFRVIEEWQPTLIIDEMDTFIEGNEELRGIINSGHNRKLAYVMRIEGDANARTPRKFSTWTPTVLAKIGDWPDTIADRIVPVTLERKFTDDRVDRLPPNHDDRCLTIRRQCQRWVNDNRNKLSVSSPKIPDVNNDRAQDNWLPLLAVADLLGGEWPEKARASMMLIERSKDGDESDDLSIMLLRDIRKLLTEHRLQHVVHSATLVERLNALDERPWPTLRNEKGISTNKLASLLRPFRLRTGSKRNPSTGANLKGYSVDDFNEVFSRYLSKE